MILQNEVEYYFMSPSWLTTHAQFFETPTNETGRLIFGTGTIGNNREQSTFQSYSVQIKIKLSAGCMHVF